MHENQGSDPESFVYFQKIFYRARKIKFSRIPGGKHWMPDDESYFHQKISHKSSVKIPGPRSIDLLLVSFVRPWRIFRSKHHHDAINSEACIAVNPIMMYRHWGQPPLTLPSMFPKWNLFLHFLVNSVNETHPANCEFPVVFSIFTTFIWCKKL